VKVEDFKALGKLPAVYELQRGFVYLVIADGKNFSYELAHSLLAKAAEDGLSFHIITTLHPGSLKVGTGTVTDGEGGTPSDGADKPGGA
jgi:hypothetical protein